MAPLHGRTGSTTCALLNESARKGRDVISNREETMPYTETTKEILTVRDIARYLHCHQSTIYRLANRGEIPAFRLGGGWRFKIDQIDRWMLRQRR
jgi:excisionase family DNA binding protein